VLLVVTKSSWHDLGEAIAGIFGRESDEALLARICPAQLSRPVHSARRALPMLTDQRDFDVWSPVYAWRWISYRIRQCGHSGMSSSRGYSRVVRALNKPEQRTPSSRARSPALLTHRIRSGVRSQVRIDRATSTRTHARAGVAHEDDSPATRMGTYHPSGTAAWGRASDRAPLWMRLCRARS